MRELKVRAWYKPYKQMCQVESLRFDGNGVYTAVLIEEPFYDRKLVEADEIVIEQFTDLKDINGREIYEGDIVSVRDSPVVVEDEEGVCYVAWSSVLAGFLLKGSDAYKFDEQSLSDLKLIVIGNIHENPELLEEK